MTFLLGLGDYLPFYYLLLFATGLEGSGVSG